MKEKILNKLQENIEQILVKDSIDYAETQMLWNYLAKLEAEEAKVKMESERFEREEKIQQLLSALN